MPRTADRRVPTARRAWQSGDLLGAVVPEAALVGDSPAGDPSRHQPCGSNRTQHVLPDTRIYVRLSDERTTRGRSIRGRPDGGEIGPANRRTYRDPRLVVGEVVKRFLLAQPDAMTVDVANREGPPGVRAGVGARGVAGGA